MSIKLKILFVGKMGFARTAYTLRFCAVSSLRGTSKTGKLSENRRFFDKLRPA